MPIYEYHCNTCEQNFEYLVFRSQEPDCCPACSSSQIIRKMSICGFVSKGGAGEPVKTAASSSSCGGCSASSCAGCGH